MGEGLLVRKGGGAIEDAWITLGAVPRDILGTYGTNYSVIIGSCNGECHAFSGYQSKSPVSKHYVRTQNGWELSVNLPRLWVESTAEFNGEFYLTAVGKLYKFDGAVFTQVSPTQIISTQYQSIKLVPHQGQLHIVCNQESNYLKHLVLQDGELVLVGTPPATVTTDNVIDVDGILYMVTLSSLKYQLYKFNDSSATWSNIATISGIEEYSIYSQTPSLFNDNGTLICSSFDKSWKFVNGGFVSCDNPLNAEYNRVAYGGKQAYCFFKSNNADPKDGDTTVFARSKILRRN